MGRVLPLLNYGELQRQLAAARTENDRLKCVIEEMELMLEGCECHKGAV